MAFEELRNYFGTGEDKFRDCTTQDLPNLTYFECCVKEALRMFPSFHFVQRLATEDFQVGKSSSLKNCKSRNEFLSF